MQGRRGRYALGWLLAARSALAQPRRLGGALVYTAAVVVSAETVQALAPPGNSAMLAPIFGGLVAFNLLLFFPPGTLAGHPLRVAAALLAFLVPLPLSPLLYQWSPALADAALVLAAGLSVLARPLGTLLNGLALLIALNLLIPLVMGGAPALAPLGALAAVVGTLLAAGADWVVAALRRARAPGFERRLLQAELAAFLADLARAWREGRVSPDPRIAARVERVRALREEVAPDGVEGVATLPPDAMLEAVERGVGALREQAGVMSPRVEAAVTRLLDALAAAARAGSPDAARQALAAIRAVAVSPPEPGELEPPPRVFGLALLLSDLVEAGIAEPAATAAAA